MLGCNCGSLIILFRSLGLVLSKSPCLVAQATTLFRLPPVGHWQRCQQLLQVGQEPVSHARLKPLPALSEMWKYLGDIPYIRKTTKSFFLVGGESCHTLKYCNEIQMLGGEHSHTHPYAQSSSQINKTRLLLFIADRWGKIHAHKQACCRQCFLHCRLVGEQQIGKHVVLQANIIRLAIVETVQNTKNPLRGESHAYGHAYICICMLGCAMLRYVLLC